MPGGRPSKPLSLVKGHRTKAERAIRDEAEKSLLTGTKMKEWPDIKSNPIAHKEFCRIRKLLQSINHNDALHESMLNRYCLLIAECKEFEDFKKALMDDLKELSEAYQQKQIDFIGYMAQKGSLQERVLACDKKIMEKRKMQLDIEKENIMTIQSALRSIPKKPQKQEDSHMAAFLKRRQAGGNEAQ